MSWRRIRRLLLISLVGFLVVKAIRTLRGPEAPAFSRHPSAWNGQTPGSGSPPSAAGSPATTPKSSPLSNRPTPEPSTATATTWVAPVDSGCPSGFPIKAKERSGIYHEPGMLAYERTNPDRCYASTAEAESDGFRAAKR